MPRRLRPYIAAGLVAVGLLATTAAPADAPNRRPTDEERGKELFDRHCFQCHGEKLHGAGPATQALVHPVPDLVGKIKVDERTINIAHRGKGAMPSYEATFDRADAKRVVQHMKRLSDEEAKRMKGPAPEKKPAEAPAQAQAPAEP